jgi:class 3 adenylate cyclase
VEYTERYLAIVLLDLIGSTAFIQSMGAMRGARWLQYHDKLARSLVYRFEGREIDRSDGFLLSFERPIDAVNFALHYQQSIPDKTKLGARIGVHWGKVVEVKQDELHTMIGAKSVELEGISKNIAARTMSLCQAGQVLLTAEAMQAVKRRTNTFTPRGTRYALAGEYRFKGVRKPQLIYTVGATIESLQPPPSSDKAKKIAGPNKIKSKARDRKLIEWLFWALYRFAFAMLLWFCFVAMPILSNRRYRLINELDDYFYWIDYIMLFITRLREVLNV